MEENKEKQLIQEQKELNTLVGRGVTFEVNDIVFERQRVFGGLFHKRIQKKITRKFTVNEPTLSTLDRLSAEWVEMAIDEERMKSENGMKEARTMVHLHSIRCAKIVAIAVLGEDAMIPRPGKGCTRWIEDTKKIDELTSLFSRRIKPSDLHNLVVLIQAMCNLGDFMNSIRLMSAERTTMPIRIEENKVG